MASFIISEVQIFTGNDIIPRGAVLVENDPIAKIILHNDAMPVGMPVGIPVISRSGYTLLPGLIDAHIHASGERCCTPARTIVAFWCYDCDGYAQ
jgi:N-acetylglucosamine-6-phosphate deacetylase